MIGTGGGAYHTTNDGGAYANRTTANGLPSNQVDGVAYFSGTTVSGTFACACDGLPVANGGCAFTTNGGTSFTVLNTASNPRLPIADAKTVDYDDSVAGATRYVVGCESLNAADTGGLIVQVGVTYVPSGTVTAASLEGGVIPLTPPLAPTWDDRLLRGIAYYHGDTTGSRFVIGGRFGASVTVNGGTVFASFTEGSSPAFANSDVRGVAFFSGDTTGNTFLVATPVGAYFTSNGGTSFTLYDTASASPLPSNNVRGVAFNNGATTATIFAVATANGLAYTTNGGTAFTIRNSGSTPPIGNNDHRAVDYFDGDTTGGRFCVATGNGVYHTQNGGAAFTNRTTGGGTNLPSNNVTSVAYSNRDATGATWIVGAVPTFSPGGIGVTINNGANFTRWNTGTTPALPSNNVTSVDWFQGSTTITDTALVGSAAGVSYMTGATTATPTVATHTVASTSGALPSNDIRGVSFFSGITTAGTWLVGTDAGVVRTTNGTAAAPTFTNFRRGTLSGYWELNVTQTTPANTQILYQILDGVGALIPDAVLAGNSAGLAPDGSGNISLAAIPVGTYPTIQVRAVLSNSVSTATPTLHSLRIRFVY